MGLVTTPLAAWENLEVAPVAECATEVRGGKKRMKSARPLPRDAAFSVSSAIGFQGSSALAIL